MSQRSKKPSVSDVARLAGVSVGTVSNSINKPEAVAPDTLKRVRSAIEELRFVPNSSARLLRTGTLKTIGVLVTDISNPYYTEMIRGMEDRFAADGYTMNLASSDMNPDREAMYLRLFEENGVQGVLIVPVSDSDNYLREMRRHGVESVLVDTSADAPGFASVAVNNAAGGFAAVSHLLDQGHTRIVFVNGPHSLSQCRDRLSGALRAITSRGLDPSSCFTEIVVEKMNATDGEQAFQQIHQEQSGNAIFCVNDLVALGMVRAIRNTGLTLPDDYAVVGYDDLPFAAELLTPLSTIRQPNYQIGHRAAEMLISRIKNPTPSNVEQVMFQPELIIRTSSNVA